MTQYLKQQKQEARLAVLEAYNSCEILLGVSIRLVSVDLHDVLRTDLG